MLRQGLAPAWEARIGGWIAALARLLAMGGGVMLAAIAVLTVISIVGRAFVFAGLGPIPGDFELVEAGCAVAVFSFLPWCQINRGHVTVDLFISRLPGRAKAALSLIGNVAISLTATIIAWRLWLGLGEKYDYGEETFILGMPVWYGYALGMIGAVVFVLTALFTVWRSLNETLRGREALP